MGAFYQKKIGSSRNWEFFQNWNWWKFLFLNILLFIHLIISQSLSNNAWERQLFSVNVAIDC
jgi:hypothetical protein